jgi:lipopolysaccharide transport system ATP-binding protein
VSEIAVSAARLTKVYRLYSRPWYRVRDLLGLLPPNGANGAYSEHVALDHVDLEVRRGEKVAIIGRNGAGKSTLLKLITRVIEPTSGRVDVAGRIHAMLQIGTGFHPDFTGRQNVLAYLAQLGVAGREAERLCAGAVEFAELEEYVDQPVKTYSTGMAARLMFSTSTTLVPDVLLLDEILGVGDAYFTQKSFERIREMCEGSGTTVLLVTHDVYSALKICNRFVWLDHGRVLLDGPSVEIVHAYERSIREQEEHRLRMKRIAAAARQSADRARPSYGQLQLHGRRPPAGRIVIAGIRLLRGAEETASVSTAALSGRGLSLELGSGDGNWSDVLECEGRRARCFLPHGSIFHRLPFLIESGAASEAIRTGAGRVELTILADPGAADPLEVLVSDPDGSAVFSGVFEMTEARGWHTRTASLERGGAALVQEAGPESARYGSRAVEIVDVRFFDGAGLETQQFPVGSKLRVAITYRINDPRFEQHPTLVVAFQKDGITRSHRFWTDRIPMRAAERDQGRIEIVADPLLLGAGTYLVTVAIFSEGYFESSARLRFFTANPDVLDMQSRRYEIVVRPSARVLCNDVVFQHPSQWFVDGCHVADTEMVDDSIEHGILTPQQSR